MEDLQQGFAQERGILQEQLDHLQDKLHEREDQMRTAIRSTTETQARAESSEGNIRRAHMQTLGGLKKRLAKLEIELADTAGKCRRLEAERLQVSRSLRSKDLFFYTVSILCNVEWCIR